MKALRTGLTGVIGVIAILAVAACATNANDLRAKGPVVVLQTGKAPELFRDCLVGAAPSAVTATPFGQGWMVSRVDTHPFVSFVEIVPEGSGSRISVYGARGIRTSSEQCL